MIYCFGHGFPYTDIDSLTSSILLEHYYKKSGYEAEAVYVNQSSLRESTIEIFKLSGLDMPRLITPEELLREDVEFAMVDHNDVMESFGQYQIDKEVLICVDHHTIQGNLKAKEIRFRKVGATATLIAEMCFDKNIALNDMLARAAVLGIISDTMGLKNVKASDADRKMVDTLYEKYDIGISFEELSEKTVSQVLIKNMTIERILTNSLREYAGGKVGIAQLFALNDDYKHKIDEIKKAAWDTKYDLYIFAFHIQKENKSVVYYFDKKYNIFPAYEEYHRMISRSKDLLPHVLTQLKLRSTY